MFSGVVWCNVVRHGISAVFDCVVLFVHLAWCLCQQQFTLHHCPKNTRGKVPSVAITLWILLWCVAGRIYHVALRCVGMVYCTRCTIQGALRCQAGSSKHALPCHFFRNKKYHGMLVWRIGRGTLFKVNCIAKLAPQGVLCPAIFQEEERQRRLRERARALIAEARASQDLPEMVTERQDGQNPSRPTSMEPGMKSRGRLYGIPCGAMCYHPWGA